MIVNQIMLICDKNARTSNIIIIRVNSINVVNDYGSKLLTVCKSSGLRIFNRRHSIGMDKDFTFVGPSGMSVVDYLLSSPDVFN